MSDTALLSVRGLVKHYQITDRLLFGRRKKPIRAVDGVSFDIYPGETFGLVGESGCGKTTTGRLVLRLVEATSGSIKFNGQEIRTLTPKQLRMLRKDIQFVSQDPSSSLDPRMTIRDVLAEPLRVHRIAVGADIDRKIDSLLERVGLSSQVGGRYPHEFSGGQRQRISIARALAVEPKFIVCDEPVSALDVSIQSQILNLMKDLQSEMNLTYLFISHDLSVVRHISNRVAVMYLGKVVEINERTALFDAPAHPYTRALLSAVPIPDPTAKRSQIMLEGEVPSPINPPSGCRFHPRCPESIVECSQIEPALAKIDDKTLSACIRRNGQFQ